MKTVILVTGASSGFGALAVRALARAGHIVYGSMTDIRGHNASQVEAAKEFSAANSVDLRSVELDVTSQESVDSAVKTIFDSERRLDVVVHNAGHMAFGPLKRLLWSSSPISTTSTYWGPNA